MLYFQVLNKTFIPIQFFSMWHRLHLLKSCKCKEANKTKIFNEKKRIRTRTKNLSSIGKNLLAKKCWNNMEKGGCVFWGIFWALFQYLLSWFLKSIFYIFIKKDFQVMIERTYTLLRAILYLKNVLGSENIFCKMDSY